MEFQTAPKQNSFMGWSYKLIGANVGSDKGHTTMGVGKASCNY